MPTHWHAFGSKDGSLPEKTGEMVRTEAWPKSLMGQDRPNPTSAACRLCPQQRKSEPPTETDDLCHVWAAVSWQAPIASPLRRALPSPRPVAYPRAGAASRAKDFM
jgi:hypothetical protein